MAFALAVAVHAGPAGAMPSPGSEPAHTALMPGFPPAATAGWFAVITLPTTPVRVIVNLFDDNASLMHSTTHLGADRTGIGVCVDSPEGTHDSQVARNPGAAPRLLFIRGTGLEDA